MPIMSQTVLVELPEQPVLSRRTTLHFFREFPSFAQDTFRQVEALAAKEGLLFAGPPFACYHNTNLEALDVEVGYPLARAFSGSGAVAGRVIPAHREVCGLFLGPYGESDPLMEAIMGWIAENGHSPLGPIFNRYLNDEQRPESDLLTQIAVPII